MIKNLLEAIYTKGINSADFYNSIDQHFYFQVAPEGTTFPYCVYFVVNDRYDWNFDSDFEEVILQFNIFDNSPSMTTKLSTAIDELQGVFDWTTLSVTGWDCVRMQRDFTMVEWLEEEECWVARVQYRILLEKQ